MVPAVAGFPGPSPGGRLALDSTECSSADQSSHTEPPNPLDHVPGRRPILGEWAWPTLKGAALVIEVSLGQTSDTVAVPSLGFLSLGTRNRFTYRLCSAYTAIVPEPTSVPCVCLLLALYKGPGAASLQELKFTWHPHVSRHTYAPSPCACHWSRSLQEGPAVEGHPAPTHLLLTVQCPSRPWSQLPLQRG